MTWLTKLSCSQFWFKKLSEPNPPHQQLNLVSLTAEVRARRPVEPGPRAPGLLHAERGGHRHAGRRARAEVIYLHLLLIIHFCINNCLLSLAIYLSVYLSIKVLLRHGARPRGRRQRLPAALLRVQGGNSIALKSCWAWATFV